MKVLVTGAGGFIGRHATAALLEAGHEVHAIVRRETGAGELSPHLHMHTLDLDDTPAVDARFSAIRPDAALHLAWYTNPVDYLHEPAENLSSLERTLGLVRRLRAAGCRRVVIGGSCLEHATGSEAATSAYANAKRAAHEGAIALAREDFRVACAHIFWVYGAHEDPRRAIPTVARAMLGGIPIDVTAGTQLREYLHVADVATALEAILASDAKGRVDIAFGERVPLRTVFEEVARAADRQGLLRFGARPMGPDDAFEVPSDPAPLHRVGLRRPAFTLRDGITDAVTWWRQQIKAQQAQPISEGA